MDGRIELKEHDDAKLLRREERLTTLLHSAVDNYVYAIELFDAWTASRAKSKTEVQQVLRGKPEAQQLEYLRKQIEMRVLGLGWTQFATRWSCNKDARIGTVKHLTELRAGGRSGAAEEARDPICFWPVPHLIFCRTKERHTR